MVAFNKYHTYIEAQFEGAHNLGSDTLKVALTNTAPTVASDSGLSDISEISAGNGYTAGGTQAATSSSAQTSGNYKLVLADVVFTASGGSIGPFRYAVLYNDTASGDEVIGYWDRGSSVSLADGESLTWDADPTNGVLQAA